MGECHSSSPDYLDDRIMPLISSCSIACGGHFGDQNSILACLSLAIANGVNCGAHISFPDRKHFGRKVHYSSSQQLVDAIKKQLELFRICANHSQVNAHHVKAHGALYHYLSINLDLADKVLDAISEFEFTLIYCMSGSPFSKKAKERKMGVWEEIFGDRKYEAKGALVKRGRPGAVLENPDQVVNQVEYWLSNGNMPNVESGKIKGRTLCFHSDTKQVVQSIKRVRKILEENNIHIA